MYFTERINSALVRIRDKPLPIVETFSTDVRANEHELSNVQFSVIEGKGHACLGHETALKLNVLRIGPNVTNVCHVNTLQPSILEEFPEVTEGFGKLKDFKLKIPTDRIVTPVIQSVCRVPYHLGDMLEKKPDELGSLDITEKVNGPTDWLSPVVHVPKNNGKDIRLCVDMGAANTAVKRECFPIPTVDEVIQELNQSCVFSKLDLKMGYFQIELDESSREITTFGTHKGSYRYKTLIMGILCAPEMYQNVMQQVLQDCEGAHNILDDITVHGSNQREHDERLRQVHIVLRKTGLTVNAEKCEPNMSHLVFMGHVLSSWGIAPTEVKVKAIVEARRPETMSEVKSFLGLVTFSS